MGDNGWFMIFIRGILTILGYCFVVVVSAIIYGPWGIFISTVVMILISLAWSWFKYCKEYDKKLASGKASIKTKSASEDSFFDSDIGGYDED